MRLWHYKLLPYLPDAQFKGQLRELVAIMHDWRDKGQTNHILINQVMEFPIEHLCAYFLEYTFEYSRRNAGAVPKCYGEFMECSNHPPLSWPLYPFHRWHNNAYLRVCMANLYEKRVFGRGKSRITDEEWKRLTDGYRFITGEVYKI